MICNLLAKLLTLHTARQHVTSAFSFLFDTRLRISLHTLALLTNQDGSYTISDEYALGEMSSYKL